MKTPRLRWWLCALGIALSGTVDAGAVESRFRVIAFVDVSCDGSCDPSVEIRADSWAILEAVAAEHAYLPWHHTTSIHQGCSAQGPIVKQHNHTVEGGYPNSPGDTTYRLLFAQGIDRWSFVSRSTAQIGGTGGTPWVLTWTSSFCDSASCGGQVPPMFADP